MRHRRRTLHLSRARAARVSLARSLARALLATGKVRTTQAKARLLQQFIEPLVATARRGDLTTRRRLTAALGDNAVASQLLARAGRYRTRPGGFTRRARLPARRRGDGASEVLVEFVE